MRRLSSDLHDGPAQPFGLALLRLDGLRATEQNRDNLAVVRSAFVNPSATCAIFAPNSSFRRFRISAFTTRSCSSSRIMKGGPGRSQLHPDRAAVGGPPVREDLPVPLRPGRAEQRVPPRGGEGAGIQAFSDGKTITVATVDRGPGMSLETAVSGVHLGLAGLRDASKALAGR